MVWVLCYKGMSKVKENNKVVGMLMPERTRGGSSHQNPEGKVCGGCCATELCLLATQGNQQGGAYE